MRMATCRACHATHSWHGPAVGGVGMAAWVTFQTDMVLNWKTCRACLLRALAGRSLQWAAWHGHHVSTVLPHTHTHTLPLGTLVEDSG